MMLRNHTARRSRTCRICTRAAHEFKRFIAIFMYLWMVLALFT